MGSFITEPAAMTLAALILGDRFFARKLSTRLKYATLGALFVNISVAARSLVCGAAGADGGRPVGLGHPFHGKHLWLEGSHCRVGQCGGSVGLVSQGAGATAAANRASDSATPPVPLSLVAVHLAFLVGVVVFAHHPPIFMGLFLFFLGITHAYEHHQDRLILKEGLLVAFFLAGLVVLGGQQQWWLQPLLMRMSSDVVFVGAIALTAFHR
jgi:hypothetical protein